MIRLLNPLVFAVAVLMAFPAPAAAQKSVVEVLGQPATPEGQPKSYLEELMLYS